MIQQKQAPAQHKKQEPEKKVAGLKRKSGLHRAKIEGLYRAGQEFFLPFLTGKIFFLG
jgi:hypothetical protein